MIEKSKSEWEEFYSQEDPYGMDKWYSNKKRREQSIELIYNLNIKFDICLELGCGEGRVTQEVIKICNEIIAVEISSKAIKRSKDLLRKYGERIRFIEADMYEIEFNKNEFDLINALEALDYTNNWEIEINKWIKWTKPDGYILFSGANMKNYFNYKDLIALFNRDEIEIINIVPVTSKFPIQYLMNRKILPQNSILWSMNMKITNLVPKIFSKHVAILTKVKK